MPTEANMQTTGTLSADIVGVWLKDELLERGERNTVFVALCDKTRIPKGNGKVVQFTRYERLALPFRPLEEGVTPSMTPMTISTVDAVLDQWGAVVGITDMAEMTVKHPTMQLARDLLSMQHEETLDREVQVVLMGSSAVYFAGNKASRALLTAADVLRTDDIRRTVATLRANGARVYSDRMSLYKGVVDPYVEGDLNKDPLFANASSYSQIKTLQDFDLGKWMGVWWQRSNHIPIISQMAAGDVTEAAQTSIPTNAVGFTAASTVRIKVTRLSSQTRFEEVIYDTAAVTDAAIFVVDLTIESTAISGIYRVYSTLEGGAAGTETFQLSINHTTGTDSVVQLVKAATGTLAAEEYVVTGSGQVAPPNAPASLNVHTSYIFGRGAVGCTELSDGFDTFFIPRKAVESDPLAQRAKASWKHAFKALVLNPDFFRRIESASDFN